MSPPAENAPISGSVPEFTTARQANKNQSTRAVNHQLILARSAALVTNTSAMASGALEPTESTLNAVAALASSLYWDLWVEVSS